MLKHFEKIKWDFDVQSKEWVSQSGRQAGSQLVSWSVSQSLKAMIAEKMIVSVTSGGDKTPPRHTLYICLSSYITHLANRSTN